MSKQALEGRRLNAFAMRPEDLTIIEDLDHPLYDPRVERPLTEAFIADIDKNGIETPVKVQKDGKAVVVVWGRRRVRAGRIVNERRRKAGAREEDLLFVPCMTFTGDERHAYARHIAENEHREADDPITRSEKLNRLLGTHGYTEKEAAGIFGLSLSQIRNLKKLIDLSSAVKRMVAKGDLSASAAGELASLPRAEQEAKARELISQGITSKERIARAVAGKREGRAPSRVRYLKRLSDFVAAKEKEGDARFAMSAEVKKFLGWLLGELDDTEAREGVAGLDFFMDEQAAKEKARVKPKGKAKKREFALEFGPGWPSVKE